jgi:Ca2+-binding RTX toxin-like protein
MTQLTGTPLDDHIVGTNGDDYIEGLGGADTLEGGYGADTLDGGPGDDYLYGGKGGKDTITYASATSAVSIDLEGRVVTGGAGTDHLNDISYAIGSPFDDTIRGWMEYRPWDLGSGLAADRIDGGAGNDLISTGYGPDTLYGSEGNDTLDGGAGFDELDGGTGDDTARYQGNRSDYVITYESSGQRYWVTERSGFDGTDVVSTTEHLAFADQVVDIADAVTPDGGTDGDDIFKGTSDADAFQGVDGADWIDGGAGNDTLIGCNGDDTLAGGAGEDWLDGSGGTDTLTYAGATQAVSVSLSDGVASGEGYDRLFGFEVVIGTDFDDTLSSSYFDVTLEGGLGNDWLRAPPANGGNNLLEGGNGNDTMYGGAGFDTLEGGAGIDTAVYSDPLSDYTLAFDWSTQILTISGHGWSAEGIDELTGVELLQFADGTRQFSDLVHLTIGTAGRDQLSGTSLSETLVGLGGSDQLLGMAGDDTLVGGSGNDTLDGGRGIDTASYAGTTTSVKATLSASGGSASGGAGNDVFRSIENLIGGDGDDLLAGNDASNFLEGGAGSDTLNGKGGADTLAGGTGNDTYIVGPSAVSILELHGEGIDTVQATVTYSLFLNPNVENLVLEGRMAIDGAGNDIDNRIDGNSASNLLTGAGGNDTLAGHDGNDTIDGGAGSDLLDGGKGGDAFYGGEGSDVYIVEDKFDKVYEETDDSFDLVKSSIDFVLPMYVEGLTLTGRAALSGSGNAAANVLIGNEGPNFLNGHEGADTLDGGLGTDTLVGGAGSDSFRFSVANPKGADLITDFNGGEDQIQLNAAAYPALPMGVLDIGAFQIGTGSAAVNADVRVIFDSTTGKLFYDADGSDIQPAVQFAAIDLAGLVGAVTHDNFEVI